MSTIFRFVECVIRLLGLCTYLPPAVLILGLPSFYHIIPTLKIKNCAATLHLHIFFVWRMVSLFDKLPYVSVCDLFPIQASFVVSDILLFIHNVRRSLFLNKL